MQRLFFSYSHKDEALRDQLEVHLAMMKRQGLIESWHDRRIDAGSDFNESISSNLEAADIILLLVSPDFLASEYCYEKEMMRAMERHAAGDAVVLPVILRPCDWHGAPFGRLLAVPKDGKPVTKWPSLDDAFLDVTTAIKARLEKHSTQAVPRAPSGGATARSTRQNPAQVQGRTSLPRSSNLRVAKEFSERDRDAFLHESFDYIASFFEGSLEELSQRNPNIEGRFRRVDANRFTAVVYRGGEARARCSVFFGEDHFTSGGIGYSNSESGGSFNERLSIEDDDQALYLKPLGLSTFGPRDEHSKLTMEGGAEFLWSLFVRPLQQR